MQLDARLDVFTSTDQASTQDHDQPETGSRTGPGPWGALPNGYCCTSNDQCRFRRCATLNGATMCTDECWTDETCKRFSPGWHCVGATQFDKGYCEPEQPTMTCLSASSFSYGPQKLGHCCIATHDLFAGQECEGNMCMMFAEEGNPYVCSQACKSTLDCVGPGDWLCSPIDVGYGLCMRTEKVYTCDP